ncbi:DnaB-like helicase C-terminal domain-containing protein [Alkalihalobacterium bogoriense]|uniref:DnaB-like helicase C-terminal domain-containing protein n=1 Tax=Alkalihalobacterium bogoriense TaxID=246272 RepID=UPI000478A4FE|nr:DnaB-like helicase C-terminal domain-containing protein [Alkalihalobacterium bogoriense]
MQSNVVAVGNEARLKIVENISKEKGDLAFSPLLFYLQGGFRTDLSKFKCETTHLLSLGLSHLDVSLNGGLTPGVHLIAGKPGDERMAFIVHLLDHFARQKFACIYLSKQENKSSFIMKLLMRNHFIQDRNTPIQAQQLVNHLQRDPQYFETAIEPISQVVKFISLENDLPEDLSHLEERMRYQKQRCEKSVFIIDIEENLAEKTKVMLDQLVKIAHELQVHIIVSLDLSENDFNNAKNGYVTTTKIESAVDSFILFSRSNTPEVSTTNDFNSPHLIEGLIRTNHPFPTLHKTFITHFPNYFYFQDA